jgi:hypothetical protein
MTRQARQKHPTLVETIASLSQVEPAFGGVSIERLRKTAERFYTDQLGRLGEYLVDKGEITRSQLDMALGRQYETMGDHAKSLEYLKMARDGVSARMSRTLDDLLGRLEKAFADA